MQPVGWAKTCWPALPVSEAFLGEVADTLLLWTEAKCVSYRAEVIAYSTK